MTIPGRGDLSPRRKHRDWRQRFAVVAVVLVVAGIGFGGYELLGGSASSSPKVLPRCAAASPPPHTAPEVRLTVRNATLKTGLAAQVAHDLRQRGFHIGKVGNTPFRGKGVVTVRYSADRLNAARVVAAHFDGATLTPVADTKVLELDIGPKFRKLVPIEQAETAARLILASPSPSPSVTPTPTCAPRPVASTP